MDEPTFWAALEHRVTGEMFRIDECRRRGMWCDGFVANTLELDALPNRIAGRVWVGLGPRAQEDWSFELLLPAAVRARDAIRWSELLPGDGVTGWMDVDHDGKHLVVAAPGTVASEVRRQP